MSKKTRRSKNTVKVDFTGVSAGGGRVLPEDRYTFEVLDVSLETSDNSGSDYLAFELEVVEGEFQGTKAWDNMSLQPQALWKLRGFMEAAGLETEDGPMDIDPTDFVGVAVDADVIHEEYKGKTKHRVDTYYPVDGEGETESEEETEAEEEPARKRRKKAEPEPEGDEDEEWTVKQKVSFMDGKKKLNGTITEVGDGMATVKVGRDEYEVDFEDLTAE